MFTIAPGIQVLLARNLIFAFFISIIPVVGLKVLRLDPSNLGSAFTSLGVGSVLGAVVILPWARATCDAGVGSGPSCQLVCAIWGRARAKAVQGSCLGR
jgi:hypothetical protein